MPSPRLFAWRAETQHAFRVATRWIPPPVAHRARARVLPVNRADPGRTQAIFQLLAQGHVLVKQIGIVAIRVPSRFPGLVVAQPEPVRMCLLSQSFLPLLSGLTYRLFLAGERLVSLLDSSL